MIPGNCRSAKTESTLILILSLVGQVGFTPAQDQLSADSLIADLGCSGCHPGIEVTNHARARAPDLGHAGLRYRESYLFDYLQNPVTIRRHIGLSRMPDFHFSPKEALALVLFLKSQVHVSPPKASVPPVVTDSSGPSLSPRAVAAEGKRILKILECNACHGRSGEGTATAVDLSTTGYRLNARWLKDYLLDPSRFDGEDTPMPASFFRLSHQGDSYEEIMPEAGRMLVIVATYLSTQGRSHSVRLQKAFDAARAAYPGLDHEVGEKIFLSQNCLACHEHNSLLPWRSHTAPDLSVEGSRVQPEWLKIYLKSPHPIRPFGFYPGSGSRMPDFSLTDQEAEILAVYLSTQKDAIAESAPEVRGERLSPYERHKARRLVEEELSCLGCHRLGDKGGRIGPSLSGLKSRLKPGFVYQMIIDPQGLVPESVMPRTVMREKDLELVTRFLLGQTGVESPIQYLSLVDFPLHFPPDAQGAEDIYGLYCASCHGIQGQGNGYNREFLDVAPVALSDPVLLSQRADDTLFDGIYSGGLILGKSPLMPPFGNTIERSEIRRVVAHLRELCGCQGPDWSRETDGYP